MLNAMYYLNIISTEERKTRKLFVGNKHSVSKLQLVFKKKPLKRIAYLVYI